MSGKTKSDRASNLIAAIQRKLPENPAPPPEPEPAGNSTTPHPARTTRRAPKAPPKARRGSGAQFWLHDEDRRLLRELSAWLAGQGVRATDSLVIRAALRAVKTGNGFLEAYRQASQLDGRLRRHKSESAHSGEAT
jgi:hypothetical protein